VSVTAPLERSRAEEDSAEEAPRGRVALAAELRRSSTVLELHVTFAVSLAQRHAARALQPAGLPGHRRRVHTLRREDLRHRDVEVSGAARPMLERSD
jgi:hypothetical protein